MTIEYTKKLALFDGAASVEDAENLLQWIQQHPRGKFDFSRCTHVHAAALQVLMASDVTVLIWPHDDNLKTWLRAALTT